MNKCKKNKRNKYKIKYQSKMGFRDFEKNFQILLLKTNKYLYAQLLNITGNKTINTQRASLVGKDKKNNIENLAKNISDQCKIKKINPQINKNSHPYHGNIKIFIDSYLSQN